MNTPVEFEAVREGNTRFSMAGKWVNRNEGMRNKPVSRSSGAGFQFPVGRTHREMKSRLHVSIRVGATAAVYMEAVLEHVIAEVMELVGNASKDLKAKRITPKHLQLSIKGDEHLDMLIKGTIGGGGIIPHINKDSFKISSFPKVLELFTIKVLETDGELADF